MANLPTIKISKNRFPLRKKLIISYFLFFLIILNSFLYLPISYHYSSLFFREFLKENQKLDLLSKELQTLLFYTETYISNNKTTDLIQLNNTINKIKIIINTNFYKYEDLSYIIKDIIATVRTTIETANP